MNTETTASVESSAITELTIQQRAVIALSSPKAELELRELARKSQAIVTITNADGRTECHTAAMAARNARINIEKAGKSAREDATAFSKAVIAEEKRLVDLISPEETRLLTLRDGWDARVKAEKEAKEAAERARIEAIRKKIDEIRQSVTTAALMDAASAKAVLVLTDELQIDDSFAELYGEAMEVRGETIAKLREIVATKEAAEATAARIKAEQAAEAERLEAERKRLDAERAEQERIAAENRAAEERRQAEERAHLDAERAELDRQRKELESAQAEQKRISDEKSASERAEQESIAAAELATAQGGAEQQVQQLAVCGEQISESETQATLPITGEEETLVKEIIRIEPVADNGPTIKLGDISERLGFTVTADFLSRLGFQPVTTERSAKLYRESNFGSICSAIISHVQSVANGSMKLAA